MDLQLLDRVALVTGGSSGLGLGCVEQLLSEGARVLIASRTNRAMSVASELNEAYPNRVRGIAADISDAQSCSEMIDMVMNLWGRLDVLLLSGGGPPSSSFLDTDDEAWRLAFEGVFLGPVRMARMAATTIEPGGCIAFVLSSSVYAPIPGLVISNGLRPGLAMAMKSLSDELAPRGIRVVGLAPGRIATARTLAVDAATPDVSLERNRRIPLGRLGEIAEFARIATFAISPAASYMTGTCLVIDGGAQRRV